MLYLRSERKTFTQDFTYPVYVMNKDVILTYITGWPEKKTDSRFYVDSTSLPNCAHFPTYSQWVAAHAAAALGIPLEDDRSANIYAPGQIPKEWFDASKIRLAITMSPTFRC